MAAESKTAATRPFGRKRCGLPPALSFVLPPPLRCLVPVSARIVGPTAPTRQVPGGPQSEWFATSSSEAADFPPGRLERCPVRASGNPSPRNQAAVITQALVGAAAVAELPRLVVSGAGGGRGEVGRFTPDNSRGNSVGISMLSAPMALPCKGGYLNSPGCLPPFVRRVIGVSLVSKCEKASVGWLLRTYQTRVSENKTDGERQTAKTT